MNELTEIGKITKPQGLKGELKIQAISGNLERFLDYDYIYLGQEQVKAKVLKARVQKGFVYLQIENVSDIEQAEELRNQLIYIDKSQLPMLEDGEYFITDLIGCKVCDENNEDFGVIVDIDNFGGADIITIKDSRTKKEIMFPFLDRVVKLVDVSNSIVVVNRKDFDEVRVDEN